MLTNPSPFASPSIGTVTGWAATTDPILNRIANITNPWGFKKAKSPG